MDEVTKLEAELVEWTGMPYVVACSSGTAALHLALEALEVVKEHSFIWMPDYTMIACPRAATMAGLKPVFVDCNQHDLLMAMRRVPEGSVVMPVHVYGRRCDMESLFAKHPSCVVEDMAELHGVQPHFRTDSACWSFYKNKVVHGEEGGCVGFKEKQHADLARSLRCLGFTDKHDYYHRPRGCNYRLANTLARQIRKSLRRVDAEITARRDVETLYDELCPEKWRQPARQSPWVYDVRIPRLEDQRELVTRLNDVGIAARQGFKRMTSQEEYGVSGLGFSEAAKASSEVLYLPLATSRMDAKRSFRILIENAKELV